MRRILRDTRGPRGEITRADRARSLDDPTGFYEWCVRYFEMQLPAALRAHRAWFSQEQRGYGEDAFHVLWRLLDREFSMAAFLEIGVYRAQILSLVALLQQRAGRTPCVTGISPFTSAGGSVSRYLANLDYESDTRRNFHHFGLPEPILVKAYSTDPVAQQAIRSRRWDCIYIDGNHDYHVAHADWLHCSAAVPSGGLVVLDDASLDTNYRPPAFATAGHPGPSRIAKEIDRAQFEEIVWVGHNRVFLRV